MCDVTLGYVVALAWCCCPCLKLECDTKEMEKRSCFLKAVQRRRRERARKSRAARDGVAYSPVDEDDEFEEP